MPNAAADAAVLPHAAEALVMPNALGRGSQYAELSRQIKSAGLLDRRVRYYGLTIAVTTAAMVAGWAAFVRVGDSWWQLVVAVFLAIVFAQIGFLAHDAGHRQVFASRRYNDLAGVLLANLCVGLAYRWWVESHNRHHSHPNEEGKDPDMEIPALAFTAGQAAGRGRLARFVYQYQAYFFLPLLSLTALGLHADSARNLAAGGVRGRFVERALFIAHLAGYLGVVFLVLSPVKAVVFVLVQQGLLGPYLGCSFAPNHKGMATLDADDRRDFLRRQVLTSRNIRGGLLVDLVLGGLNYQIEHHLFPNMPRSNLRHAHRSSGGSARTTVCPTASPACRTRTRRCCGTSIPSAARADPQHQHRQVAGVRHPRLPGTGRAPGRGDAVGPTNIPPDTCLECAAGKVVTSRRRIPAHRRFQRIGSAMAPPTGGRRAYR